MLEPDKWQARVTLEMLLVSALLASLVLNLARLPGSDVEQRLATHNVT